MNQVRGKKTVQLIMAATAMSQNADLQFTVLTDQEPVLMFERTPKVAKSLGALLSKLSGNQELQDLLTKYMFDYGNFLEIEAELRRQKAAGLEGQVPYSYWQQSANAVLSIIGNKSFHFMRPYIVQTPFIHKQGMSRQQAIQATKAQSGIPMNVDWDAVSFKVPPKGSEYFCVKNSNMIQTLTNQDIALLNGAQDQVHATLTSSLATSRGLLQLTEDSSWDDYTQLLENFVAGDMNYWQRTRLLNMGDSALIDYVIGSTNAFIQGIIPGGIQPGAITACQDVVSMSKLQQAIKNIASQQVYQISNGMENPAARYGMQSTARDYGKPFSKEANASITAKANITQQTILASASLGDPDHYNKAKQLSSGLTGGPNTLTDQILLQSQGRTVNMTPLQLELLNQSLSLMLACLRVRFDATTQVKGETVSQNDLDHLVILERLANHLELNSMSFFNKAAVVLRETMAQGHNKTVISQMTLNQEVIQRAINQATGNFNALVKQVQALDMDQQQGSGQMSQELFSLVLLSLADTNRRLRQLKERQIRRNAFFYALDDQPENIGLVEQDTNLVQGTATQVVVSPPPLIEKQQQI